MRRVVGNFIYNFTGNVGSRILLLGVLAFITRAYGSDVYGEYNIALSEFTYFSMFATLGTDSYGLYLIAKLHDCGECQKLINDIFSIKVLLGSIVSIALFGYCFFIPGAHPYTIVLIGLLIFQAFDMSWVFNAVQDMKIPAYKGSIITVLETVLIVLLYFVGVKNVYGLLIARVCATVLTNLFTLSKLKNKHGFSIHLVKPKVFRYLRKSTPYMASGVFAGLNTNIDIIIMGYTISTTQIGYYSASYKLVNEFVAICSVLFGTFYPLLIDKISHDDFDYVNKLYSYLCSILMCFILPCIAIMFIYGKEILTFLFGSDFSDGYKPLVILMIFVGILYYREIYGYTLSAAGKQNVYLRVVMISALFNIITNIIFIPKFGITAAALTTLGSEVVNLLGMQYYAINHIGIKIIIGNNIGKLLLSVFIISIFLVICKSINLYFAISITLSVGLYILICLKLQLIDLSLIKKVIINKSEI